MDPNANLNFNNAWLNKCNYTKWDIFTMAHRSMELKEEIDLIKTISSHDKCDFEKERKSAWPKISRIKPHLRY